MACGQYDGPLEAPSVGTHRAAHPSALQDQLVHTAAEVYLTARGDDLLAHATDDDGELVRTDMRVGIDKDLGVGTEAAEDTQRLLDAPALLTAGVELTVGEGARPAFAVAVIGLGVDDPRTLQLDDVAAALHHVLPAL